MTEDQKQQRKAFAEGQIDTLDATLEHTRQVMNSMMNSMPQQQKLKAARAAELALNEIEKAAKETGNEVGFLAAFICIESIYKNFQTHMRQYTQTL